MEEGTTVASLKDALSDEYVRQTIKFILKGSILSDEAASLSSIGLEESDTLVLIGKKCSLDFGKKEPQQATMANAYRALRNVGNNSTSENSTETKDAEQKPEQALPIAEEVVQNIISMGFDRATVLDALDKALYHPELAVEYCLNGIPQSMSGDIMQEIHEEESPQHESASPEDLQHLRNLLAGSTDTAPQGLTELSKSLRDLPNFDRIRSLALENSQMFQIVLEQFQLKYPEIYRLIQQKPEEFVQHISQGISQRAPRTIVVDRGAIERLMNIGGFSQEEATRAYILANRNEDIAASILFEALEQQTSSGSSGL